MVQREGDVGVRMVWRPEVKNALTKKTIEALSAGFDELIEDDAIKGPILTERESWSCAAF